MYSMRAVVADLDGKIIALGGVYRAGDQVIGFSEMKEEMRGRKKDMLRMVRLGAPLLLRHRQVIAYASPAEPTASSFLTALGFRYFGADNLGEVYIWQRWQAPQEQPYPCSGQ